MIEEHKIDLNHISKNLILFISQDKLNTLFLNNNPDIHEAKYQLKEGCSYDFSFSEKGFSLRCPNHKSIVNPHNKEAHVGKIQPNIYVGTLDLEIYKTQNGDEIFPLQLEVQSVKTNYRDDYRKMLSDIAEYSTDLILQANSPVNQSLEINPDLDNQSLYQRFSFIRSMIENEDFELAINKIIYNPSTQWKHKHTYTDVRKVKRFKSRELNSLLSSTNKVKLPHSHPLKGKLSAIATKVRSVENFEDYDTNENRFIKYALETYLKFCEDIHNHKNSKTQLKKESKTIIEVLENHLQDSFFKSLSQPHTLNINSPLLQRKSGYREQLKLWLQFDLAAKLIWEGGDDVYKAGKKDIAVLYEYWLFFQLLRVMKKVFQVEHDDISNLIKNNGSDLSLQLKQGNFKAIEGIYNKGNRLLKIVFNYNRTFKSQPAELKSDNDRSLAGSWTNSMRPDFSLSVWPEELSAKEAEKQEQIVHIHFDAKYKIANLHLFLESDLDQEKSDNRQGLYKNADLLKMHAYKDAIKRTGGAYVLYPGTESKIIKGFHEVLPGLGAFAISPEKEHNPTSEIEEFLENVLHHFLNRISQREKIAAKTFKITEREEHYLDELMPEFINGEKLIPDEIFVLIGFYESREHLNLIEKGVYCFSMESKTGPLILDKEIVSAEYLLLNDHNDELRGDLWRITSKGPKVYSKEKLIEKGFTNPEEDYYLAIEIEKVKDIEFEGVHWDFKNLCNQESDSTSENLFSISLSKLMKYKI